jgi:hypothetical protein
MGRGAARREEVGFYIAREGVNVFTSGSFFPYTDFRSIRFLAVAPQYWEAFGLLIPVLLSA